MRDASLARLAGSRKPWPTLQNRDVSESDTVTIVRDILGDAFGFDKYSEVTGELAIRGTFVDLAVKVDDTIQYLVEVKAIGLTLAENHLRQAVNYGANQGIPWVVLTNGVTWEVYRIKFERPVGHENVFSFDFLKLDLKHSEDLTRLFLLCREGTAKAAIEEFHERVRIINRFVLAAIIQSEPCLVVLRRELNRLRRGTNVTFEEIRHVLPDVLKRDVLEGEAPSEAQLRVKRAHAPRRKAARARARAAATKKTDLPVVPPTGTGAVPK